MRRTLAVVGVVSLLLVSGVAAPVAGSNGTDADRVDYPAVHVDLEADGDATVSLVSTYDLTDDDERDAFETLREDDTSQAEILDRFADRLDGVASDVEVDVDRDMTVTAESVDVRTTDDDRGIVTLAVNWTGLAAVEDETIVLAEPFSSGFESDRTLVVVPPDGATVESATPDPTSHDDGQVTWDGITDLDGFEATISLEGSGSDDSSDGVPGFGPVVAVVALALCLASVAVARR